MPTNDTPLTPRPDLTDAVSLAELFGGRYNVTGAELFGETGGHCYRGTVRHASVRTGTIVIALTDCDTTSAHGVPEDLRLVLERLVTDPFVTVDGDCFTFEGRHRVGGETDVVASGADSTATAAADKKDKKPPDPGSVNGPVVRYTLRLKAA